MSDMNIIITETKRTYASSGVMRIDVPIQVIA